MMNAKGKLAKAFNEARARMEFFLNADDHISPVNAKHTKCP